MNNAPSTSERTLGKSILLGLSYCLILAGFVGWVGGFLISMGAIPYKSELPWGDCKGFVVDRDGITYVGSGFYSIVETYDTNGSFLNHFPARSGGGDFFLALDSIGQVVVSGARNNNRFTIDRTGTILYRGEAANDWKKPDMSEQITSSKGDIYQMGNTFVPSIEQNGNPYIKQGLLISLFSGPFPAFLYAIAGLALNVTLRRDESWNPMLRR